MIEKEINQSKNMSLKRRPIRRRKTKKKTMRKPTKPNSPKTPTKPSKMLTNTWIERFHGDIVEQCLFDDVAKELGVSSDKVYLELIFEDGDWYDRDDHGSYRLFWKCDEPRTNENYEKEMIKYKKALENHAKKLKIYDKKLEKWQKEIKIYNEENRPKEVKKLKKELSGLNKNISDLKGKLADLGESI